MASTGKQELLTNQEDLVNVGVQEAGEKEAGSVLTTALGACCRALSRSLRPPSPLLHACITWLTAPRGHQLHRAVTVGEVFFLEFMGTGDP